MFFDRPQTNFLFDFLYPKRAAPRTQRHDKQPLTQPIHVICTEETDARKFCDGNAVASFSSGWADSPPAGKARAFLREPCARLGKIPQRRRNIIGTLPLDIFARKRGRNMLPSRIFNCVSILTGFMHSVNMRHLFSQ